MLTRDEGRILLGIRSGHNHLNHCMHERLHLSDFPTGQCYCGNDIYDIYDKAWYEWVKDPERDMPYWTARDIDITAVRAIAFPI